MIFIAGPFDAGSYGSVVGIRRKLKKQPAALAQPYFPATKWNPTALRFNFSTPERFGNRNVESYARRAILTLPAASLIRRLVFTALITA